MNTPKTRMSKKIKKELKEDFLSSSGVSTLSGLGNEIRKVVVYKNGDMFHQGVKFVINTKTLKDLDHFLNQINDKIQLSHGAKKLYTTDGKRLSSIREIENGKSYVAVSSHFKTLRYGEIKEKVWKPPSRRGSPIFREDRIRTARTRSQEPHATRRDNSEMSIRKERSASVKQPRQSRPREPAKTMTSLRSNFNKTQETKKSGQPVRSAKKEEKPKTPAKRPSAVNGNRPKTKDKKISIPPQPIPTTAVEPPSPIALPTVIGNGNAEILEFPDEKVVNVQTIHKSPSPPKTPAKEPEPEENESTIEVNGNKEEDVGTASNSEESDEETENEEDEEESEEEASEKEAEGKTSKPASRKSSKA